MDIVQLVDLLEPEGIWAALSLLLIVYIIKTQEKRDSRQDLREQNYQEIISNLSDALKDVKEIKELLQRNLNSH